MILSRSDENELLTALHDGLHDTPRFRTFLERLRRRIRADYVGLIFRQGNEPIHRATELWSGQNLRAQVRQLGDFTGIDPIPYDRLRPGRVYSTHEMVDPQDPAFSAFRAYLEALNASCGRFMRITEPGGMSAWVVVTRHRADFTAADSAVLGALAPHLSIALRNFTALERERFRGTVAEDALGRAGIGWTAIDGEGRVIAASPTAQAQMAQSRVRLATGSPDADRELARLREAFQRGKTGAAQAVSLGDGDQRGLLAVPVPEQPLAALALPVLIALTRAPPAGGDANIRTRAQAEALRKLFGLSMNEARLALTIAAGRSLDEAAESLGLTIETVRDYSKRAYAKTGTRGQADLARLVLTSVATLA